MITHAVCGREWSGRSRSHCPACHETFSGESAADKHRTGRYGGERRCLLPSEAGLIAKPKPWGTLWALPGSVPEFWREASATDGN